MNTMNMLYKAMCKAQLKKHEGFSASIYTDTVGVPTGGYGHAFLQGSVLPEYIWDLVFEIDYAIADAAVEKLMIEKGVSPDIKPARKMVLVNMAYNLGETKLRKFHNTWKCISEERYEDASKSMRSSLWAKQVGSRAKELADQMKTGRLPNVNPKWG